MVSPVGLIELRWPRKIELLFGRTPERALADAARTLSRAIKKPGFPSTIQQLSLEWKVVFMDEELPETQIPQFLVTNCHPGWMTPPANIYIVAQRVTAGCQEKNQLPRSVADSQLAEVLIHEMGHAVEYQMLGSAFGQDHLRAEGFASWFEEYASNLSSVIPRGQVKKMYFQLAKKSIAQNPGVFEFRGTAYDYGRSSMYFHAIVERGNLYSLANVYATMREEHLNFFGAINKRLGWDKKRLEDEVLRLLK